MHFSVIYHLRSLARQRLYWLKFLRNSKIEVFYLLQFVLVIRSEKILCGFHPKKKFSAVHSAFPFTLRCVRECRSAMRTRWQLFRLPQPENTLIFMFFSCACDRLTLICLCNFFPQHLTPVQTLSYMNRLRRASVTCRSTFWIIMQIIGVRMPRRCFGVRRDWKIDFPAMKMGKNLSHPKSWQKINKSRGLVGVVCGTCHLCFIFYASSACLCINRSFFM